MSTIEAGRGAALVELRRYREAMSDFDDVLAESPGYFEDEEVKRYLDRARLALSAGQDA